MFFFITCSWFSLTLYFSVRDQAPEGSLACKSISCYVLNLRLADDPRYMDEGIVSRVPLGSNYSPHCAGKRVTLPHTGRPTVDHLREESCRALV